MSEDIAYTYFVSASVRAARISKRVDRLELQIGDDGDFLWEQMQINSVYDFLIQIWLPKGPISKHPLHSFNLGSPVLPFTVFPGVLLPRKYHLAIDVQNVLSIDRKWNRIELAFHGRKVWEVG